MAKIQKNAYSSFIIEHLSFIIDCYYIANMKRIQLFELEDQPWLPGWLRTCMTNLIVVMHGVFGTSEVLAKLIARGLKESGESEVVDLCAGAGGSMPEVMELLKKDYNLPNVRLTMTDLYPNADALKKFNQPDQPNISYLAEPVNATNFETAPAGLKTMVNCFHHMPPPQAKQILQSAQENRQALLIYDMGDNKMPTLVWWLLLPISLVIMVIMTLFITLKVRPLTLTQIVFTYLIPIIPLCFAWDGQASLPRLYTLEDMDELLADLDSTKDYVWEKKVIQGKKKWQAGTYLLGLPC